MRKFAGSFVAWNRRASLLLFIGLALSVSGLISFQTSVSASGIGPMVFGTDIRSLRKTPAIPEALRTEALQLANQSLAAAPVGTVPQVTAPGPQTATETFSQPFTLGSFIDPDNGPWTVTVAWGDGSTNSFPVAAAGSLGVQPHI
ncbi:MAG TPA: hypothetical protein VHQ01_03945, partial [Pyrinomonadaceae bacterium]|nr:hypothetical protein [Pyrinomonadaceae bacterium]